MSSLQKVVSCLARSVVVLHHLLWVHLYAYMNSMNSSSSTWISKVKQQLQHPISFQKILGRIFCLGDRTLPREFPRRTVGLVQRGTGHWWLWHVNTAYRSREPLLYEETPECQGLHLLPGSLIFFFPVTKRSAILAAKIQSVAIFLPKYTSIWKYLCLTITESKPTLEWNYYNSIL